MSEMEQQSEEDKENSSNRSRKPKHSAVEENSGHVQSVAQPSDNYTAYQETVIGNNNGQVDVESKETQLKEELLKHVPKTVKPGEAESFQTSLQAITTRCELLIKFTDRAQLIPGIATKTDTPTFQDLLNLLKMYRNGLAELLKERCYYFLINANREKALSYAEQLANLADTLLDKDMKEEAEIISSSDVLLTSMLLQQKHEQAQTEKKEFLKKVESDYQKRAEYAIFFMLYYHHIDLFNMQESLDTISEGLEIACELEDKEMMIDMVSRMAYTYQILGKYKASYNILTDVLKLQIDNELMKHRALNNFSVTALLLGEEEFSLSCAEKALEMSKVTGNQTYMACAYGNIGLAKESMGRYSEAFEPYRECLKLGLACRNERVINNSYCNLGRAHEGLGENDEARKYYEKADNTPQPPRSHWCDTEKMRFSGDFLLAKLAVSEKNWPEAKHYLHQVIERCKKFRRSVQDSSIKITFNDTQRKPYQYLQHVLLEKREKENALFVAEQGRARDFYDKFAQEEGDQDDCLNTPQALLDFVKSQNVAVLFLSTLEVVDKLCGWFISPDGSSIKAFSTAQSEWEKVLHELCAVMYLLQGRHVVEFRGVEQKEDEDEGNANIQKAFELLKKSNRGSTEAIPVSADVCGDDEHDGKHETNSARNQEIGESCLTSETKSRFTNAPTSELLHDSPQASGTDKGIRHHPNSSRNYEAIKMRKPSIPSETKSGFKNTSTSELLNDSQSDLQPYGSEEGTFTNTSTSELLNDSQSDQIQPYGSEEGTFTNTSTSELSESGQSDHSQASGTEEEIRAQQYSDNTKELSILIDKLSDLVLKPIEKELEKLIGEGSAGTKPRLLVIPQGKSFNIPYAALRLKNKQPLCSQVTILEAFSFHSFFNSIKQHEISKDETHNLEDALIVGNPTNDLPGAETEAKQIAELLGVSALIGESASYKEVLSRISHHRIIHFACHGQLHKSSLQLAPVQNEQGSSSSKHEKAGVLTAADIEKLKIRADMVVLSACHTARGKINSEGVLGLARAFLVAGAKSVVTALWAIPDEGTRHFMKQFYLNLCDGQPVADALRETMCQIREKADFKDVINWGAFKVYGHNQRVVFNGSLGAHGY